MKFATALIATLALTVSALAQTTTTTGPPKPTSVAYSLSPTQVDFLYLCDGYDNFAAFSKAIPALTPASFPKGLTVNGIGAYDPNDLQHKVYAGMGLAYRYEVYKGWAVTGIVGVKGLNLADNFKFQDGQYAFVLGLGVSVPLGR